MASFLSKLFQTQKEEIKPQLVETPEQKKMGKMLTEYAGRYGEGLPSPYEPYGGRLSAMMPGAYGQIDPLLQQYTGQAPSEMRGLGEEEIRKTLTGEYDPMTSPYYKSMRKGILGETEEAQHRLRQIAQKGGMFKSMGRMLEEADVEGQGLGRLEDVAAGLTERERERRFQAGPMAAQMGAYGEEKPVRSLSAIASFGGIPAEFEQAGLGREYNEYLRQKEGEQIPLGLAERYMYNYQPTMMYPKYSESPSYLSQGLGYAKDIASIYSSVTGGGGGGGGSSSFMPSTNLEGGYAGLEKGVKKKLSTYSQQYPWLQ